MSKANHSDPSPGPHRTCVGCRVRRPQGDLIRLHLDGEDVVVDRNGHGRGAWLCGQSAALCLAEAVQKRAFNRAFRRSPTQSSLAKLASELGA